MKSFLRFIYSRLCTRITLIQSLFKIGLLLCVIGGTIFTALFGKINWSMPSWFAFLFTLGKQSSAKLSGIIVLIVGVGFLSLKTCNYYRSLPGPILVDAIITSPEVYFEDDESSQAINSDNDSLPALTISFSYTHSTIHPKRIRLLHCIFLLLTDIPIA